MGFAKRFVMFLLIIILLGLLSFYWPNLTGNVTNNQQQTTYEKEPAVVTKIVDGDTIHADINGKDETIRLLGINTPEKGKPYAKEAKDFLKEIENKTVLLLRDKEDTDRYERKLRYVFYDERFINVEIIENGLATTFMLENLKYKDKFTSAENFARENGIGLWKKSTDVCVDCIKLVELNPEIDYFIIKNQCEITCSLTGWLVKDDANHFFKLDNLNSQEEKTYKSEKEVWNDDGDRFFMRDDEGKLVVFYEY